MKQAVQSAKELQQHLMSAMNVNTGKVDLSILSKNLKTANTDLAKLSKSLLNIGPQGQKAFNKLAQVIAQADAPIIRTNKLLTSLWITMKNTMKWQLTSSALNIFTRGISSAINYAKDLNSSLNNIRIVTGQSASQMENFAKQANKAAKELSASTLAYTDAALIYYQQGLDNQQVKERTDATIKMANVTGESAKQISSYMTAIWNNFADGSKQLEYYADVMAKLGAATAASTEEIATGLEKFAGIAETVGLSYEYATSALATLVAETRQSPETVGTALKTIFSRLQGLSLGETLEDGTTLNKYSEALATAGVYIKEQDGSLKDMDKILDELGRKWTMLAEDQKMALAQTVGGVRQYTQLITLMDNYKDFKINVDVAEGASGALDEQAFIYAQSWEAASKRVQASIEGLYQSILDDKFFKEILDFTSEFVNGFSRMIESSGGLPSILLLISSILTQKLAPQISQTLTNTINNLSIITGQEQARINLMSQQIVNTAKLVNSEHNVTKVYKDQLAVTQNQLLARNMISEKSSFLTSDQQQQVTEYYNRLQALSEITNQYVVELEKLKLASNEAKSAITSQLSNAGADTSAIKGIMDLYDKIIKQQQTMRSHNTKMNIFSISEDDIVKVKYGTKQFDEFSQSLGRNKEIIKVHTNQIKNSLEDAFNKNVISEEAYREMQQMIPNLEQLDNAFKNIDSPEKLRTAFESVGISANNLNIIIDKLEQEFLQSGTAFADTSLDAEQTRAALQRYREVAEQLKITQDGLRNSLKASNDIFKQLKDTMNSYDSSLTSAVSAIGSAAGAITSLIMGFQSLRAALEEDATPMERFMSILMGISMIAPGVTSAIKLIGSIKKLSKKETLENAVALGVEAAAEKVNTETKKENIKVTASKKPVMDMEQKEHYESAASKVVDAKAESFLNGKKRSRGIGSHRYSVKSKNTGKSIKFGSTKVSGAGKITAGSIGLGVLGGVVGGFLGASLVKGVIDLFNQFDKVEDQYNRAITNYAAAAENLSEWSNKLSEASSKIETINKQLDILSKPQEAFDGLIKGTAEWNAKLIETNRTTLDLLSSYGLLKQKNYFKDTQGLIQLTEQGKKALEKSSNKILLEAQQKEMQARIMENEFNTDKKIASARQQVAIANESLDMGTFWANTGGQATGGAAGGAALGAALTSWLGPGAGIGAAIGGGVGALVGAVKGIIDGISQGGEQQDKEFADAFEQVAKYMAKNEDANWETALNELDLSTDFENLIRSNEDLQKSLNETADAFRIESENRTAYMRENIQSYLENQGDKNATEVSTIVGSTTHIDALVEKEREKLVKSGYGTKDLSQIDKVNDAAREYMQQYAKAIGLEGYKLTDTWGNDDNRKFVYEVNGNEFTVSLEEMLDKIAVANAEESAQKVSEQVSKRYNEIMSGNFAQEYNLSDEENLGLQAFMKYAGAGNNISVLTQEEFQAFSNYIKSKGGGEAALDVAIDDGKDKTISTDTAVAYNLGDNGKEAGKRVEEDFEKKSDDYYAIVNKFVNDSSQLTMGTIEQINESFNTIFSNFGKETGNKILSDYEDIVKTLNPKDQLEAIKLFGQVDWNSYDSTEQFILNMMDAGYALQGTSDPLLHFVDNLREINNTTPSLDDFVEDLRLINDVLRELKQGDTVSKEDYEDIIEDNPTLADNFIQVNDKTYKFLGTSGEDMANTAEKNYQEKMKNTITDKMAFVQDFNEYSQNSKNDAKIAASNKGAMIGGAVGPNNEVLSYDYSKNDDKYYWMRGSNFVDFDDYYDNEAEYIVAALAQSYFGDKYSETGVINTARVQAEAASDSSYDSTKSKGGAVYYQAPDGTIYDPDYLLSLITTRDYNKALEETEKINYENLSDIQKISDDDLKAIAQKIYNEYTEENYEESKDSIVQLLKYAGYTNLDNLSEAASDNANEQAITQFRNNLLDVLNPANYMGEWEQLVGNMTSPTAWINGLPDEYKNNEKYRKALLALSGDSLEMYEAILEYFEALDSGDQERITNAEKEVKLIEESYNLEKKIASLREKTAEHLAALEDEDKSNDEQAYKSLAKVINETYGTSYTGEDLESDPELLKAVKNLVYGVNSIEEYNRSMLQIYSDPNFLKKQTDLEELDDEKINLLSMLMRKMDDVDNEEELKQVYIKMAQLLDKDFGPFMTLLNTLLGLNIPPETIAFFEALGGIKDAETINDIESALNATEGEGENKKSKLSAEQKKEVEEAINAGGGTAVTVEDENGQKAEVTVKVKVDGQGNINFTDSEGNDISTNKILDANGIVERISGIDGITVNYNSSGDIVINEPFTKEGLLSGAASVVGNESAEVQSRLAAKLEDAKDLYPEVTAAYNKYIGALRKGKATEQDYLEFWNAISDADQINDYKESIEKASEAYKIITDEASSARQVADAYEDISDNLDDIFNTDIFDGEFVKNNFSLVMDFLENGTKTPSFNKFRENYYKKLKEEFQTLNLQDTTWISSEGMAVDIPINLEVDTQKLEEVFGSLQNFADQAQAAFDGLTGPEPSTDGLTKLIEGLVAAGIEAGKAGSLIAAFAASAPSTITTDYIINIVQKFSQDGTWISGFIDAATGLESKTFDSREKAKKFLQNSKNKGGYGLGNLDAEAILNTYGNTTDSSGVFEISAAGMLKAHNYAYGSSAITPPTGTKPVTIEFNGSNFNTAAEETSPTDNGGGGGGGDAKDTTPEKKVKKFTALMEQLKEVLEQLEAEYSRLEKKSSEYLTTDEGRLAHLIGLNTNLEEQLKTQGEILSISKEELSKAQQEMLKWIKESELTYDAEGRITNKALIEQSFDHSIADALTSDEQSTLEEQKSLAIEAIENYNEIIQMMRDAEDGILDATIQINTNNLELITLPYEIIQKARERERQHIDEYLGWLDGVENQSLTRIVENADKMSSLTDQYLANETKIGILLASGLTTQAQRDALEEAINERYALRGEMLEVQKTIIEETGVILEEWSEKLDRNLDKFGRINSLLDMYSSIMEVIGKTTEEHQEMTLSVMDAQVKNSKVQLSAAKEMMDAYEQSYYYYKAEYNKAVASNDAIAIQSWKEQMEAAEDKLNEATDTFRDKWQSTLDLILKRYELAVEQTITRLEDSLSPAKTLEEKNEMYEKLFEQSDRFLTNEERIYELNKMSRQINQQISKDANILTQQKLLGVQKIINELQEDNAKLTDYQLSKLQKIYDLRLAEIALEEAQNNKTQARLVRNSQGNWNYVFTANQNQLDQAAQQLEDAKYAYYSNAKEQTNNISKEILENEKALTEDLSNVKRADYKTEAEYKTALDKITKYYLDKDKYLRASLKEALNDVGMNYKDSVLGQLEGYKTLEDGHTNLVTSTQKAVEEMVKHFTNFEKEVDDTMAQAGSSYKGFTSELSTSLENIDNWSETAREKISKECGLMVEALDKVITKIKELSKSGILSDNNSETNNKIKTESDKIDESLKEGIYHEGTDYTAAAIKLYETYGDTVKKVIQKVVNHLRNQKILSGKYKDEVGNAIELSGEEFWKQVISQSSIAGTKKFNGKLTDLLNSSDDATNKAMKNILEEIASMAPTFFDTDKLSGFDTGGYTGDWNSSEGRLAMLHEKEIVLNKADTKNLLSAVEVLHGMSSSIAGMILGNAGAQMTGLSRAITTAAISSMPTLLQQEVHIDASFPGVTSAQEIENALNNIINDVAQYAEIKNL